MSKPKRQPVKRRPSVSRRAAPVHVIRPRAQWSDLVLPAAQTRTLQQIVTRTKAGPRAGGSALFAGADGPGRTLAAEVIARELGLPLYRVDLAAVVSKYLGETEKNLGRIFDVAERGGAILFFDEADALFGKRTDVKDSHDRYANLEVNFLLQRMESFQGLVIVTSNMKSNIDPAFLRRLRYIVEFPKPKKWPR